MLILTQTPRRSARMPGTELAPPSPAFFFPACSSQGQPPDAQVGGIRRRNRICLEILPTLADETDRLSDTDNRQLPVSIPILWSSPLTPARDWLVVHPASGLGTRVLMSSTPRFLVQRGYNPRLFRDPMAAVTGDGCHFFCGRRQ